MDTVLFQKKTFLDHIHLSISGQIKKKLRHHLEKLSMWASVYVKRWVYKTREKQQNGMKGRHFLIKKIHAISLESVVGGGRVVWKT